jgi:hypothetical protein
VQLAVAQLISRAEIKGFEEAHDIASSSSCLTTILSAQHFHDLPQDFAKTSSEQDFNKRSRQVITITLDKDDLVSEKIGEPAPQ